MRRELTNPREGWETTVRDLGLVYSHTRHPDGTMRPYWDESGYYSFSLSEVLTLERATNDLHEMCLAAAQTVIDGQRYAELGIPAAAVPLIEKTWEEEPPSVYGRFDLSYDGEGGPAKLLEYNADTPTALVEAGVVQWQWMEAQFPGADQWNSIHERLIATWRHVQPHLSGRFLHVAHTSADTSGEDLMNAAYLRDTATQAGIPAIGIAVEDIGWSPSRSAFVDPAEQTITSVFKLYPWEWLLEDSFADRVLASLSSATSPVTWVEPIWKMLLSNKGILAVLWELYPDHPNLLPAYLDGPRDLTSYVRKPLLSREGANLEINAGRDSLSTTGPYYGAPTVWQGYAPLPYLTAGLDGGHPVLGTWVIGGEAAGLGIRESSGLVTDNLSRFVPHIIS